jgi:SEC-C motif-containing protein
VTEPNDPCPCGSGRKFKRCHGAETTAGAHRHDAAPDAGADPGFDPFAKIFRDDGAIDVEYAGKRIGTLVELLRKRPLFFEFRVDADLLAEKLLAGDAVPLRDAQGEDAFEDALRAFSKARLHELVPDDLPVRLRAAFLEFSRETVHSRRDRAAAAIGVALLSGVPDATGLRGRSLLDLVLRVTLEEVHALEELRRKGRETEGGLPEAELDAFWREYPAIRWNNEQRYRREVTKILEEIDQGNMPAVISADLAMRGAHALLTEVARRKAEGGDTSPVQAQAVLREPYEQDFLDGGREVVVGRLRAARDVDPGGTGDDRRRYQRIVSGALRIVEDAGPGADAILFYSYLRAVVNGQYYVRDRAEAEAARGMFTVAGLAPEGAAAFAKYLEEIGDTDTLRRVAIAAIELWPDDENLRAVAQAVGDRDAAAARATRQGPTFIDEAIAEEEEG